jgi:endonuclease III
MSNPTKKGSVKKAAAKKAKPAKASKNPRAAAFRRESKEAKGARAQEIVRRLKELYPDARCSLNFQSPFQLLVATILSAQCTDERVNMVTPALFERFPEPEDMAAARSEELEQLIKSTGFYRNKTKSLLGMSNALVERHGGQVPDDMDALVHLPGVGRKTANVLLGNAFGKAVGIVVDTHVTRLSNRLGLTTHNDAVKIEQDLVKLIPREDWTILAHLFIDHGRAVCKAPTPRCEVCVLNDICPSSRV